MPILLLIRHGENDYSRTGKLAGRLPGVKLNERGRKQAEELGKAFAEIPIAAIYSSPLERALQTAEPIAKARGLNIIQAPGLLEVKRWGLAGQIDRQAGADQVLEDRTKRSVTRAPPRRRKLPADPNAHRIDARHDLCEAQRPRDAGLRLSF